MIGSALARRLSSGVSVAATGLRRAGEGSASCFLSRISGWRDRRLYPLAGAAEVARRIRCAPWPAPVLSFFMIGSALARRLSSGVSVAATGLRRAGEGSASCFLSRISGWRDRRLYPLAGGSRGGAANPVRAVAGAGAVIFYDWVGGRLSSGVSVAATGLRRAGEGGLRRAFSLGFPAGAIVVFIHWRGQPRWRGESGARRGRRRCCHFL